MSGFVKLHRSILENPVLKKSSDRMAVWIFLLCSATHTEYSVFFKGERFKLQPGQLITSRKSISLDRNIEQSRVQRILKLFEEHQMIEQQTSSESRLITILNWQSYQNSEQQFEQQVNSDRTASEQQVNTNKNERMKEGKKKEEDIDVLKAKFVPPTLEEIKEAIREKEYKNVDAEVFFYHYESKGWKVGKEKMKSWLGALAGWDARNRAEVPIQNSQAKLDLPEWYDEPAVKEKKLDDVSREQLIKQLKEGL